MVICFNTHGKWLDQSHETGPSDQSENSGLLEKRVVKKQVFEQTVSNTMRCMVLIVKKEKKTVLKSMKSTLNAVFCPAFKLP